MTDPFRRTGGSIVGCFEAPVLVFVCLFVSKTYHPAQTLIQHSEYSAAAATAPIAIPAFTFETSRK